MCKINSHQKTKGCTILKRLIRLQSKPDNFKEDLLGLKKIKLLGCIGTSWKTLRVFIHKPRRAGLPLYTWKDAILPREQDDLNYEKNNHCIRPQAQTFLVIRPNDQQIIETPNLQILVISNCLAKITQCQTRATQVKKTQ